MDSKHGHIIILFAASDMYVQGRENVLKAGMGRWGRAGRDLDQTRFCELLLLWAESVCDTIFIQEQGIARGKDYPFELEFHVWEHANRRSGRVETSLDAPIRDEKRRLTFSHRLFSCRMVKGRFASRSRREIEIEPRSGTIFSGRDFTRKYLNISLSGNNDHIKRDGKYACIASKRRDYSVDGIQVLSTSGASLICFNR